MKITHPPIYFENNLLSAQALIKLLKKQSGRFALIADEKVASLYAKPFLTFMKKEELHCHLVTFQGGEKSKTRKTKEEIENKLLSQRLGRDTLLIVMGGGVTTDIGGFVASTYLRGVPYISIPTSLLAMVDASIGGKTGVNIKQAKNIIGAIYFPLAIFMDFSMLSTLPDSEILCGTAEILKVGLIANKHLFEELKEKTSLWKKRNADLFKKLIHQSVKIKQKIVEQDLKKYGKRDILNFGHTIGHAIEVLEGYTLSHGEAIAIGMVIEAFIAHKMETLNGSDFNTIYQLIRKMGFALKISKKVSVSSMKEVMAYDKKSEGAIPHFVILSGIGKVHHFKRNYSFGVDRIVLDEALTWMVTEFQR